MLRLQRVLASGPQPGGDERLSRNDAFHLLSNRRRRYALHFLQQRDGTVELGDLAEQVAAWENDTTVEALDSDERKSVYISLHQSHLPKMDEIGVVEYDTDRNTVTLTDSASQLAMHLEVVPERHLPWSEFYLALSAVGVALAVAVWADVYPLTLLPDVAWAGLVAVAFGVAAAVHSYTARSVRLGAEGPPDEIAEQ